MFDCVLIANRGEIACRVIATARRLGLRTVAVYSDADRDALHVRLADEAVHIGAPPAAQSYLRSDRILDAAKSAGAQAIHPGYGFLSENAAFARACEKAGLLFIGPPASAIDAMGSKARAKALMGNAGLPLIPGYHGDDQDETVLREAADRMGYPVLLKATAGGGGKGMRAVHGADEFREALAAARREAQASFGDERMLVEKLIERPRHVEVQVFCDAHGNGVYLSDRDCSIQRRHQKVIEEAPAPGLSAELRREMGEAAVRAAQAINYLGAGTMEFLVDAQHRFYFMEMNTRLQVEHPVTEWVTGQDLVEWQLRVAAGETLPLSQDEVRISGHAIEARIYAEDPERDFLPSTGVIHFLRTPAQGDTVRIDSGIEEGSEITPHYDPMIAKLIVRGASRDDARQTLSIALSGYRVAGVATNLEFLQRIVRSEGFSMADLDTAFLSRHASALCRQPGTGRLRDLAGAVALLYARREAANSGHSQALSSPWSRSQGWRLNLPATQSFEVKYEGEDVTLELIFSRDNAQLRTGEDSVNLRWSTSGDRLYLELEGRSYDAATALSGNQLTLFWHDGIARIEERVWEADDDVAAAGSTDFAAPMHGTVVAHLAKPGVQVAAGDGVIVLEAMKMEQTLRAPVAGRVNSYRAAPGDLVDRGELLVDFTADAAR